MTNAVRLGKEAFFFCIALPVLVLAVLAYKLRLLVFIAAGLLAVAAYAMAEDLIEPTPQEAADIATWIPKSCCRTNNCCRKVHEGALIQLPKNEVRVVTTGQVLPRTGWSQDRNTWRCTCDWNDTTKQWDVHPHANTRCVFPHHSGV